MLGGPPKPLFRIQTDRPHRSYPEPLVGMHRVPANLAVLEMSVSDRLKAAQTGRG